MPCARSGGWFASGPSRRRFGTAEGAEADGSVDDAEAGGEAVDFDSQGDAGEGTAEVEDESDAAKEDPLNVHQGDSQYVRDRRASSAQLGALRREYRLNPKLGKSRTAKRSKARGAARERRREAYRMRALVYPAEDISSRQEEMRAIKSELHEVRQFIEFHSKTRKWMNSHHNQHKFRDYEAYLRWRERKEVGERIRSGEYLVREEDLDSWVERRLNDTSMHIKFVPRR